MSDEARADADLISAMLDNIDGIPDEDGKHALVADGRTTRHDRSLCKPFVCGWEPVR